MSGLRWDKPEGEEWDTYVRVTVAVNRFMRDAAPIAFTWVEWSLVLALIRYVELRTGLWPLSALPWILGALLWLYFAQLFARKADEPHLVRWYTPAEVRSGVKWAVAGLVATACMVSTSFWFAEVFRQHPF